MKKYILYIGLGLNILMACNTKGNQIEEGAYNPYDTSEDMPSLDSSTDTIYSIDSITNPQKPGSKNSH